MQGYSFIHFFRDFLFSFSDTLHGPQLKLLTKRTIECLISDYSGWEHITLSHCLRKSTNYTFTFSVSEFEKLKIKESNTHTVVGYDNNYEAYGYIPIIDARISRSNHQSCDSKNDKFGKGSLVLMNVDLTCGTLEFCVNGKKHGIFFTFTPQDFMLCISMVGKVTLRLDAVNIQ